MVEEKSNLVDNSSPHRGGILFLLALSGMLGPLSSSSYYPALNEIRVSLEASQSIMDVTVSAFLFAMALAPLGWGTWADNYGRRMPFLISTALFTAASCGCALTPNISLLIFFRIMQGIGSAAALAVSMGSLSDLFPREERGKALGIFSAGPLLGPLIGPLLGGLINQYLGWRSIFWMNGGLAGGLLLGLLCFLPETLASERRQPSPIRLTRGPLGITRGGRIPNPLTPLLYFKYVKVILPAFYSCILVATFYAIAVSQSTMLAPRYHLNSAQAGLTYLPLGFGDMMGAILGGRVADWTLRSATKKYSPHPAPAESRLPAIFPMVLLIGGSLIAVGFCLDYGAPLYATMICQFLTTLAMAFAFGLMAAYVLDLFPLHAASISAACNLVRSASAGIVTSINAILFQYLGFIGTFGFLAALQFLGLLIFAFLLYRGSRLAPHTDPTPTPYDAPPTPYSHHDPTRPIYCPSTHSLFLSSMHNLTTVNLDLLPPPSSPTFPSSPTLPSPPTLPPSRSTPILHIIPTTQDSHSPLPSPRHPHHSPPLSSPHAPPPLSPPSSP